jgi:CheY-like chemotaxis protein
MNATGVVLIGEDETDDAFFLERALQETGFTLRIRVLRDGQKILDYVQGRPPYENRSDNPLPALLILDLKMPVLSGFDVLVWRQHEPQLRSIPVVIFSGLESETSITRALSLGANRFIAKSHEPSDWAALLKPIIEEYCLGSVVNADRLKPGINPKLGELQ